LWKRKQLQESKNSSDKDLDTNKRECPSAEGIRQEFYYFDHGKEDFYKIADQLPGLKTDRISKVLYESYSKYWGEIFGIFNVIIALFITFFLQLYR
jgi:hypothetical protein